MPSDQTKSAIRPLSDGVGDQVAAAFDAEGEDGDRKVWHSAVPEDTPYPYAAYKARQMPSVLMSNKDDDPVRGIVEIQIWSLDDITAEELAAAVQDRCCDKSNYPTVDGWRVVWHDLVFNEPLDQIREDAPNIYRRVLEIEYQLDPT